MSQSALPASFENLCYLYTYKFSYRNNYKYFNSYSAVTVFKRQNVTSKYGPRTVRVEYRSLKIVCLKSYFKYLFFLSGVGEL